MNDRASLFRLRPLGEEQSRVACRQVSGGAADPLLPVRSERVEVLRDDDSDLGRSGSPLICV